MIIALVAGADQDGLVNDLGADAIYTSTESGALAEITFTIVTDGTWTITVGSGDALGGGPSSGTWLASGSASDYEVLFTPSGGGGSPTITNGASSYTAISANRAFKVEKNNADASSDLTVAIRRITSPPRVLSEFMTLEVYGAV